MAALRHAPIRHGHGHSHAPGSQDNFLLPVALCLGLGGNRSRRNGQEHGHAEISQRKYFSFCPLLGSSRDEGFQTTGRKPFEKRSQSGIISSPCKASLERAELNADIKGGVAALGKFDALHLGHRALAEAAARLGPPWMLSFDGMAEVLGWEPRLPLVAPPDRPRVLGGWPAREARLAFRTVRGLTAEAFVQLLKEDLRVKGVVAGENYRFGYRAQGTAEDLERLSRKHGLLVHIVDPVLDVPCSDGTATERRSSKAIKESEEIKEIEGEKCVGREGGRERGECGSGGEEGRQVSSSRVRRELACGDMETVARLLGRRYRLVFSLPGGVGGEEWEQGGGSSALRKPIQKLVVPQSNFLNQPPKKGRYLCSVFVYEDGTEDLTEAWNNARFVEVVVDIEEDGAHLFLEGASRGSALVEGKVVALEF